MRDYGPSAPLGCPAGDPGAGELGRIPPAPEGLQDSAEELLARLCSKALIFRLSGSMYEFHTVYMDFIGLVYGVTEGLARSRKAVDPFCQASSPEYARLHTCTWSAE